MKKYIVLVAVILIVGFKYPDYLVPLELLIVFAAIIYFLTKKENK